jgi:hypothetical protein
VEVVKGLEASERVVVNGNFLIDAESNLRAGTEAFGHAHGGQEGKVSPSGAAAPPAPIDATAPQPAAAAPAAGTGHQGH